MTWFRVYSEGNRAFLKLPTVPKWEFTFASDAGSAWASALLANDINERLEAAIKSARADAYAQGWKDAKKKTKRRDYFSGWLQVE